ncbi:GntR family transcriptional regulator [Tropicimonas sediminicola]|uniref:Transcriptional regulator, GntR family n=1 Tax=Tropicimonas sediminicola TaxID=1031541 RepID=A0A239KP70_9RHOB|nr:GntR family transcriptional regulator [Tropicimonas sediminicola]SNT18974.1 transcriptional regulator, GntR family [Tropicimonas sediminicola]
MTTQEAKTPEHEAIYMRLRQMILFGEVAPGEPLTILGLRERIGAGMTPVREAIRRLTAEGALAALGNRRINVPEMTLNHLEQIAFARRSIEPELARRAAERANPEMIQELREIDRRLDQAIGSGDVRGYLEQNYRFHFRLYEQADADVLLTLASGLWMRVGPSLRIVCGRYGTSNLPDQHDAAIDALVAGDAHKVCAAMEQDILQGLDQIRNSLKESGADTA